MRRNGTALFKKRNYLEDFLEQKQRKIGRRRPKVSKNLTFFVEKIIFRKKVMVAFGGFNNFAYRFICSKRVRPLFCIIRYNGTRNV